MTHLKANDITLPGLLLPRTLLVRQMPTSSIVAHSVSLGFERCLDGVEIRVRAETLVRVISLELVWSRSLLGCSPQGAASHGSGTDHDVLTGYTGHNCPLRLFLEIRSMLDSVKTAHPHRIPIRPIRASSEASQSHLAQNEP